MEFIGAVPHRDTVQEGDSNQQIIFFMNCLLHELSNHNYPPWDRQPLGNCMTFQIAQKTTLCTLLGFPNRFLACPLIVALCISMLYAHITPSALPIALLALYSAVCPFVLTIVSHNPALVHFTCLVHYSPSLMLLIRRVLNLHQQNCLLLSHCQYLHLSNFK